MLNYLKTVLFGNSVDGLKAFNGALFAAIVLRVGIFCILHPFNCDSPGHLEYIFYVKNHCAMPSSGVGHETWQPPLYYIITALLAFIAETPKCMQVCSLVTSIVTVFVARNLLYSDTYLRTKECKWVAFYIICFLPQFVMYGLQLSNDSLAVLLGFLAFQGTNRLLKKSSTTNFIMGALVLSFGLLTKAQFIVVAGLLFPFSCFCYLRNNRVSSTRIIFTLTAFIILACGCAKYVQNVMQYGKPFVNEMDFNPDYLQANRGTSVVDVNILKLIVEPTWSESTRHSAPLLLYGTFWYHYFNDSNFCGDLMAAPKFIGRYMYIIGFVPAGLLLFGLPFAIRKIPHFLRLGWIKCPEPEMLKNCAVAAFIGSVVMLFCIFLKYDFWAILQARYLFPTIIGGFVLCDRATQSIHSVVNLTRLFSFWRQLFGIGVFAYFITEAALQL